MPGKESEEYLCFQNWPLAFREHIWMTRKGVSGVAKCGDELAIQAGTIWQEDQRDALVSCDCICSVWCLFGWTGERISPQEEVKEKASGTPALNCCPWLPLGKAQWVGGSALL